MKFVIVLISTIFLTAHVKANAQDFAARKQALGEIPATADAICDKIEHGGTETQSELAGKIDAQLPGVTSKLIGLGVEGAAKLKDQQYQGVLRDQLAITIIHTADCRKDVFDKLIRVLLPTEVPSGVMKTVGNLGLELQDCQAGLGSLQCSFVLTAVRPGMRVLIGDEPRGGLQSELIPEHSHRPYPAKVGLDSPHQYGIAISQIQIGVPRMAFVTVQGLPADIDAGQLIIGYELDNQPGRAEFQFKAQN